MDKIEYRCKNCGQKVWKDILPLKHAVQNARRKIMDEAGCCSNPNYVDDTGFVEPEETTRKIAIRP
jgi:hypothetical protein